MFIAMLDHPEFVRFDLSTLRTGIMAGSPCPVQVMRRVVERMHMSEVTIACPGVPGELLTRGYSVMQGYWDDPAATQAAIDEARFMHTGDLATIDAEGYRFSPTWSSSSIRVSTSPSRLRG
jgi:fatty-acyl-CoA synthase